MATSISVSNSGAFAGGASSGQRGYVGYSASKTWVMQYKFTTPSQMVTSLTFRAAWYQFNFSSYPVRAQITTSSSDYANAQANAGYSYIGTAVAETSGNYNVAVHLNNLTLSANTTYYLYLFPDSNYGGNYRHYAHDANAGQTNYLEVTTHTHSYTSVVTQPTCTAQGYTTHKCSCGSSYVDTYTSALGHSYAAATCTTPQTCTRCKTTTGSALGHSWNSGVITTEPTYSTDGVKTYTCTRSGCGTTKTEIIQRLGVRKRLVPTVFVGSEEYIPYVFEDSEWNILEPFVHDGTVFESY